MLYLCAQGVSLLSWGHTEPEAGREGMLCCDQRRFRCAEKNCCRTNHPDLADLRTDASAGLLLAEEPNLCRRIIRVSDRKIIHCLKAALSSKQA